MVREEEELDAPLLLRRGAGLFARMASSSCVCVCVFIWVYMTDYMYVCEYLK